MALLLATPVPWSHAHHRQCEELVLGALGCFALSLCWLTHAVCVCVMHVCMYTQVTVLNGMGVTGQIVSRVSLKCRESVSLCCKHEPI